ncbi:hypothetical protein OA2633_02371 [Oceanicaulis sp. HTCC2633]|uniref:hypothetical protein n=1 Tax=Oceanicaulis sp. HTCC2633 TaxID=314254 RepID=UPI000066D598|nr:hypothetical protein [Oceanicaulis sp. HTCC2633]EAP90982.1 hypothetical protein OA2633_02371 [Oceanicaulis sp. HTCC2633]
MTLISCHPAFDRFLESYKSIAKANGVSWHTPTDEAGQIIKAFRWDLNEITGAPKPPAFYLKDLGTDLATLKALASGNPEQNHSLEKIPLSDGWADLIKALTIRSLFELRNSAHYTCNAIGRSVRALASCCSGSEPWEITREDVVRALGVLEKIDKNQKLKSLAEAQVVIFDTLGLSAHCPLNRKRSSGQSRNRDTTIIRASIDDRRKGDRLPGATEFWELLRILLEEQPLGSYDAVRFLAAELHLLMGLRVGETVTVPVDPLVSQSYFDPRGGKPSLIGGVDRTLFLRHFAEKQELSDHTGAIHAEATTSVLRLFEQRISELVETATRMTAPLRQRLTSQLKTGRILPEFELDEIVSLEDVFTQLTGNPFGLDGAFNLDLAEKYRATFDVEVLHEIRDYQARLKRDRANYTQPLRTFFGRKENAWIPRILIDPADASRRLINVRIPIGELERQIRLNIPTKLSDTEPFPLEGGRELKADQSLFLVPKRALIEGRNGGVCDITRYAFVGRLTPSDLGMAFGTQKVGKGASQSFYAKYGKPEFRSLNFKSHSSRHMHNNELFAAGVADTIITNRFGRKSVAQSHEYDSRTLAQELDAMELPDGSEDLLTGPARDAFKLISAGRAQGPIADEFRRIQEAEGDEAAIVFLATEADGMQITPYGLCMNSFVVEPCPKHLECFNGCCHLVRTGSALEERQLDKLAGRYRTLLSTIDKHPGTQASKAAARRQAEERLTAIEQARGAAPGKQVFPDGPDLGKRYGEKKIEGLL